MYLTGLIHRDKLYDVSVRWLHDDRHPRDGRDVTEIFLFESLVSGPAVRGLVLNLLKEIHDGRLELELVRTKDRLREIVIAGIPDRTPHMQGLIEAYRANPEEFFPRTPIDALVFWEEHGRPFAIHRIKRMRRVIEKASRRVADCLLDQIRAEGTVLARERAQRQGVDIRNLFTPAEEMTREFTEAERRVAQRFKDARVPFEKPGLRVDDVIGLKIIGTDQELARAEAAIARMEGVRVAEREVHSGDYNAVNLLLDVDLPPNGVIVAGTRHLDWGSMATRGLDAEALKRAFPAYVESGARDFRVEVILTTYDELVESELGRSIHEERIIRQREARPYRGRIAKNAEFILEYLLTLAFSPRTDVGELPIKMWGHYLPDTLSYAARRLWGLEEPGILHRQLSSWYWEHEPEGSPSGWVP
jgi:hypothetical protein